MRFITGLVLHPPTSCRVACAVIRREKMGKTVFFIPPRLLRYSSLAVFLCLIHSRHPTRNPKDRIGPVAGTCVLAVASRTCDLENAVPHETTPCTGLPEINVLIYHSKSERRESWRHACTADYTPWEALLHVVTTRYDGISCNIHDALRSKATNTRV